MSVGLSLKDIGSDASVKIQRHGEKAVEFSHKRTRHVDFEDYINAFSW